MTDETTQTPKIEVVLVCINRRFRGDQPSCAARGSEALADALDAAIVERNLAVRLERSICMGQCTKGPTVRFAPGGAFHLGAGPENIANIVDELERLCGTKDLDHVPPLHLLGS